MKAMEHIINYLSQMSAKVEVLGSKVLLGCYMLFGGLYWLNKSSISWGLSLVVGLLASANYLDQMIQRRKNKKQNNGSN